jgi:outer membrane protein OmpA-like peptidoglycan-associated protein
MKEVICFAGTLCLLLATASTASCATRRGVGEDTRRAEEALEQVEVATEATLRGLEQEEREAAAAAALLEREEEELSAATVAAYQALARAREAEQVAAGRLQPETVYVVEGLRFPPGTTALDPEARSILDQLAERLAMENAGYYLEVQGHADASGSEAANLQIGRARAEEVERYLHREKGIPLHRIGVVSFGSTAPAADNRTEEGRSQNRRVVVVVLR